MSPSYKTAFGSFLKTKDLQGRQIRVVIESVGIEDVKTEKGTEKKLVVHFAGKNKALVLNRTNCEGLAQITGTDNYDAWVGHAVVLFPTTTKYGGDTVPCLRICGPQVQVPVSPLPPPPPAPVTSSFEEDDAIPF